MASWPVSLTGFELDGVSAPGVCGAVPPLFLVAAVTLVVMVIELYVPLGTMGI